MKHIVQYGRDGFGHQLHGIYSAMVYHGVENFYYDGIHYTNKSCVFDHIKDPNEKKDLEEYLKECHRQFSASFDQKEKKYNKVIHSHEIYKIPANYDVNTLYSLDNAFFFNYPLKEEDHKELLKRNMIDFQKFFINPRLPKCSLPSNNVVVHIRMGDAMRAGRGNIITKYKSDIKKLIDLIYKKDNTKQFVFHTDGSVDDLIKDLPTGCYKVFNKSHNLLYVLSDLIHADMLITGVSSLSTVATYINQNKVCIIDDTWRHIYPSNCVKITEYIKKIE